MEIEIVLNGERYPVSEGTSVERLVEGLGLRPAQVAVEVNRAVVRRAERPARLLGRGDEVEVVTLVGGG